VIVIQSRASGELVWRDEVLRTNHFKAYMTAKAKARLTGRVYRLVDRDGVVLEQIIH
jgi:uridine kinase